MTKQGPIMSGEFESCMFVDRCCIAKWNGNDVEYCHEHELRKKESIDNVNLPSNDSCCKFDCWWWMTSRRDEPCKSCVESSNFEHLEGDKDRLKHADMNNETARKVCVWLGWQGGTIHQIGDEIFRLRRIEAQVKKRLKNRVDDGYGGDFCAFCHGSRDHKPDCPYWDINTKE